jgi:hypothetical protein
MGGGWGDLLAAMKNAKSVVFCISLRTNYQHAALGIRKPTIDEIVFEEQWRKSERTKHKFAESIKNKSQQAHKQARTHTAHTHARTNGHTHAHKQIHTHTHIHTYTHTHTHRQTDTHTYTRTHSSTRKLSKPVRFYRSSCGHHLYSLKAQPESLCS